MKIRELLYSCKLAVSCYVSGLFCVQIKRNVLFSCGEGLKWIEV